MSIFRFFNFTAVSLSKSKWGSSLLKSLIILLTAPVLIPISSAILSLDLPSSHDLMAWTLIGLGIYPPISIK
jgi:hypothetical protein